MKFIKNIIIFILLNCIVSIVYSQLGTDTVKYAWEGINEGTIITERLTILTFYPDSIYVREDYLIPSSQYDLIDLKPDVEQGEYKIDKKRIKINHKKGIDNPLYGEYKIRKNSLKYVPNPDWLKIGRIRYQWLFFTKATKYRKVK